MSDIWDEEREPDALARVRREHSNAGYLAAITAAKEKAHQPGFDEGYSEGAMVGLQVGRIIGTLQAAGNTDLEAVALDELAPPKLFCEEFYDSAAQPKFDTIHPLIEKWQKRIKNLGEDSN